MAMLWGLEWYSRNLLDGVSRHLLWERPGVPMVYSTRREARSEASRRYGYIKHRKDLRSEPHGWRMPRPVRIKVTAEVLP